MKSKTMTPAAAIAKAAREAQKATRAGEFVASVYLLEFAGYPDNRVTSALIGAELHNETGKREILIDVSTTGASVRE